MSNAMSIGSSPTILAQCSLYHTVYAYKCIPRIWASEPLEVTESHRGSHPVHTTCYLRSVVTMGLGCTVSQI